MSPGNSNGRPTQEAATTNEHNTYHLNPRVPHQSDESWNAGRELGRLLGLSIADLIDDEGDEGFVHVDYHRDHLDLGWVEREEVGRELAIAGYRP